MNKTQGKDWQSSRGGEEEADKTQIKTTTITIWWQSQREWVWHFNDNHNENEYDNLMTITTVVVLVRETINKRKHLHWGNAQRLWQLWECLMMIMRMSDDDYDENVWPCQQHLLSLPWSASDNHMWRMIMGMGMGVIVGMTMRMIPRWWLSWWRVLAMITTFSMIMKTWLP